VLKDLDTFDFALTPMISKKKVPELARCEWIEQKYNACWVGNSGTGKTLKHAVGVAGEDEQRVELGATRRVPSVGEGEGLISSGPRALAVKGLPLSPEGVVCEGLAGLSVLDKFQIHGFHAHPIGL
jgi:hypothetical protein